MHSINFWPVTGLFSEVVYTGSAEGRFSRV